MQYLEYSVARTPLLSTGVKIGLATVDFHGFGVARQGPWITWVNRVGCPQGQTVSVNPVAMRAAPMSENLRCIQQFLLGRMRWNP
jgi:hypothetical protein